MAKSQRLEFSPLSELVELSGLELHPLTIVVALMSAPQQCLTTSVDVIRDANRWSGMPDSGMPDAYDNLVCRCAWWRTSFVVVIRTTSTSVEHGVYLFHRPAHPAPNQSGSANSSLANLMQ